MLRESSKLEGADVDLQVLGGHTGSGDLPAEAELLAFAETALMFDVSATKTAREKLVEVIGYDAMIDSACIIANFQRMVRIADGTGIPLDTPVAMVTAGIREELGINAFGSAENTKPTRGIARLIGLLLAEVLSLVFKQMAKRNNSKV
ncbi:MAG: hypothetical protein ACI9FB_003494 [Candidatus Azotimanducaceae bacterium]|jgi:hypothetical protein